MKKQTTIRMSAATRAKLDELTTHHGTQTEVIAVAVDRLYREEVIQMTDHAHVESTPVKVKVGETVYYPGKQGQMRQGVVAAATPNTVLFTDGNWCYTHEVSKSPK